jgi:endo-1,4-beta-xylanase
MINFFTVKLLPKLSLIFTLLLLPFLPHRADAQLAKGKPKFLGNIIRNYVPSHFDTYWNQVTPENSGKWGSVEGTRGVMNWTDLDKAYNHAKSKGYPFKQHAFVWGSQEPGWISTLSASEQAAEVEEWISLYAQRYPNTDLIDVVNEPLHVIPSYVNALGGSGTTGWDWVIWSFQKARQYCPNSKLILNDYGILGDRKATSDYIKIINLLKERGLIDGIGVQAHGLEYAQSSAIETNLNSLAETGIPIYVSELDLEHESDATQLDMYKRVFPLLYEHPGVVAVTLWGYIIGEHWKPNAYLLGSKTTAGTYTTGTAFQDYTVSGTGKVQVHLTNDDTNNSHDLEVDYVIIDGITYQAEDMALNTGVWSGTCGGSYSQWLNCNGYIEFPKASSSITVRARGVIGTETMEIRTVDDTKERLALQWLKNEYFGAGSGDGTGSVLAEAEGGTLGGTVVDSARTGFSGTGYATAFDAANDYVEVSVNLAEGGSFPLAIGYAADASIARSIRVNGSVVKKNLSFPASSTFREVELTTSFVAGTNTIRVFMERGGTSGGDIDYIKIKGASSATTVSGIPSASLDSNSPSMAGITVYPNPSNNGQFNINLNELNLDGKLNIQILDMLGRVVYEKEETAANTLEINSNLKPGLYILQVKGNSQVLAKQRVLIK